MFDLSIFGYTVGILSGLAAILWLISLVIRDVGIIDSFWSIMIMVAGFSFLIFSSTAGSARQDIVFFLLIIWALRLSLHITKRNWGQEEDKRYQEIRKNNEPGFAIKSLYIVFLLQAVLAAIVALPLMSIVGSSNTLNMIDALAITLWLTGMLFESVGDYQLSRFTACDENRGKVLDTGLWRYSRHPNYFGEFCIWWSFFLFAVAAGYWWSIISPILMTVLLLKVSGVSMLENTIGERRPAYAEYMNSTSAFFPWPPKRHLK